MRKSIEILADGVEASVLGERTLSRAHGISGGEEGEPARFTYFNKKGEAVALEAKSGPHKLSKGDRLEMITAGGGGWGTAPARNEVRGKRRRIEQ